MWFRTNFVVSSSSCTDFLYTYSNTTVVERYEAFVNLDQKADALRASRNENAKKMKGKMEKEVRDALIAEGGLYARLAERQFNLSADPA